MSQKPWMGGFFSPPDPTNIFVLQSLSRQFELVHASWRPIVDSWYESGPGREVEQFLVQRCLANPRQVMPSVPLRALNLTPQAEVRIVVFGDQPSPIGNVADGLAFSSLLGGKYCGSTAGIANELERDLGIVDSGLSTLDHWAQQGVLLLNSVLSVEHRSADSHVGIGWEQLTDHILKVLAADPVPKVFLLWGKVARTRAAAISASTNSHLVLECSAPRVAYKEVPGGFYGCGHFSQAAAFLKRRGGKIEWARGPQRA